MKRVEGAFTGRPGRGRSRDTAEAIIKREDRRSMPKKSKPGAVSAPNPQQAAERLRSIGGSRVDGFNQFIAGQAVQSLWLAHTKTDDAMQTQVAAVAAAMMGIGPRDEVEGMLAAQLLACHNAAMECFRRAMIENQTLPGRDVSLRHGAKLSRTFALLLEALNRHRGKGQQKVTVEHVHVHAGGQAVVGHVDAGTGRGGGGAGKIEERPHAKQLADAPEPEVRRADPVREAVPVAGGER